MQQNENADKGIPNVDALTDTLAELRDAGLVTETTLAPLFQEMAVKHMKGDWGTQIGEEYTTKLVEYLKEKDALVDLDSETTSDEGGPEPEEPESEAEQPEAETDEVAADEETTESDETDEDEEDETTLIMKIGETLLTFDAPVLVREVAEAVGSTNGPTAKVLLDLADTELLTKTGYGKGTRYILSSKIESETAETTEVEPDEPDDDEPTASTEDGMTTGTVTGKTIAVANPQKGRLTNQPFDTNTEWIIQAWKDQNQDHLDLETLLHGRYDSNRPDVPGLLTLLKDQGLISTEEQVWAIVDEVVESPTIRALIDFINEL